MAGGLASTITTCRSLGRELLSCHRTHFRRHGVIVPAVRGSNAVKFMMVARNPDVAAALVSSSGSHLSLSAPSVSSLASHIIAASPFLLLPASPPSIDVTSWLSPRGYSRLGQVSRAPSRRRHTRCWSFTRPALRWPLLTAEPAEAPCVLRCCMRARLLSLTSLSLATHAERLHSRPFFQRLVAAVLRSRPGD